MRTCRARLLAQAQRCEEPEQILHGAGMVEAVGAGVVGTGGQEDEERGFPVVRPLGLVAVDLGKNVGDVRNVSTAYEVALLQVAQV